MKTAAIPMKAILACRAMLSSEIPFGSYLGISLDGKLEFSLDNGIPVA
jgi:hypothetical protein